MSKILNELQFITQSAPITPNTTFGALFASGNALYFENATGTLFPLGQSGGSSNGYLTVREYTGSNPGGGTLTYTWDNNSNIKYIQVICVGAGGGGGSGAFGVNVGTTRLTGGAGGGGGAVAWRFFDKADLPNASYTISVGSGGAGGATKAWNGSSQGGDAGSTGEYTTFGETLVSASGGSGGGGGGSSGATIAGGTGGSIIDCLPGPSFAIAGGAGASTPNGINASNAADFFTTPLTPTATAGGGAGYSINLAGTLGSGSLGGGGYQWNTLIANNNTEGNSGSADIVTATVLLHFTSSVPFATTYGLGGGGNGVRTPNSYTIAGGHGGFYGAGGGGSGYARGSAQVTTQPGGSGSSGLCIVVEYY
jgi:hypothetical protein